MFRFLKTIKNWFQRTVKSQFMRFYIVFFLALIIIFAGITIPTRIRYSQNLSTLEEIYQDYRREEIEPMTWLVLLDNSSSMQSSFHNMDRQLMDCLLIQHSMLQKEDRMVIIPLCPGEEGNIDLKGTDDYEQGQNAIRGIPFFEKEESTVGSNVENGSVDGNNAGNSSADGSGVDDSSVDGWLSKVGNYVNQTDSANLRIVILTDKNVEQLNVNSYIDTDTCFTRVITSGKNLTSNDVNGYGVNYFVNADDFAATLFQTEFYFNYYSYHTSQSKSTIRTYIFPEEISQLVLIVEGEDHYISHIFGSDDDSETTEGTILSDGRCLYRYRRERGEDLLHVVATEDCPISILYPVNSENTVTMENSDSDLEIWQMALLLAVPIILYTIYRFIVHQKQKKKKIFISYRRDGAAVLAKAIGDQLHQHGYEVFLDTESLKGEKFNEKLLWQIEESDCVVAVIPPNGLDRCLKNKNDWVRKELAHAIYKNIPIIPVTMKGFEWPASLPANMVALSEYNAVNFDEVYYYHEGMKKVVEYVSYALGEKESVLQGMLRGRKAEDEE